MEDTVERVMPGTDSWKFYGYEHQQRYEFFKDYCTNKLVLDAACGTGYGSEHLLLTGAREVTGIDVSQEAISFATKNYKGVNYLLHNCMKLRELNKKFDVVISFETIEHLPDPGLFMQEVKAVLHPGGTFICSTPNKKRFSGAGDINPHHMNELEYHDFKNLFAKHFTIQKEYHQSESIAYFRYAEIKNILGRAENRSKSLFVYRMELGLRKLFGKTFPVDIPVRDDLEALHPGDMEIEPLTKVENWHKTYIIVGTA